MGTTPDFGIPEISASQANAEVTHNEAVVLLQALANGVIDKDLTAPPGSPTDGDAYIVASGATGAWNGWDDHIAVRYNGAWYFIPGYDDSNVQITIGARQEGLRVWVRDENQYYVWDGSSWNTIGVNIIGAQGSLSAEQLVTADTWTKIALDTADHNASGIFVPGNNNFVAPSDGLYSLFAKAKYTFNPIGSPADLSGYVDAMSIRFYLNDAAIANSVIRWFNDWSNSPLYLVTQWTAQLSQGDEVDVRVLFETLAGKVAADETYMNVIAL